jgi:hypothetical protein
MRALRFALALVAAVAVGIAGASAVVGSTGPDAGIGPEELQPDGTGAVIAATTVDPAAGQARGTGSTPVWAVRVYRSESGLTCPDANRSEDGDFGRVDGDGSFVPLPLVASGSCSDLSTTPYSLVVRHFPANDDRGARAVVFGVATDGVRSITLSVDGDEQALDLSNGAYVAALPEDDLAATSVDIALDDGRHVVTPLG